VGFASLPPRLFAVRRGEGRLGRGTALLSVKSCLDEKDKGTRRVGDKGKSNNQFLISKSQFPIFKIQTKKTPLSVLAKGYSNYPNFHPGLKKPLRYASLKRSEICKPNRYFYFALSGLDFRVLLINRLLRFTTPTVIIFRPFRASSDHTYTRFSLSVPKETKPNFSCALCLVPKGTFGTRDGTTFG
jgi:hypothetical protein